ncbi:MAG TPA: tetratricopeptide repeat protein, partial [Patescibacteria group bacterium]|nr:tetratricopeptide repeat protein [Patescibacteria group bacterium]
RSRLNPRQMEQELTRNPGDFEAALNLASEYFQLGQTGAAVQALDRILNSSNVPTALLRTLLPLYSALSNESKLRQTVALLNTQLQNNPANLEAAIGIAEGDRALHQPQEARQALQKVLDSPAAGPNAIVQMAQQFMALSDYPMLEKALEKLTRVAPESPETWYDLAALRSILGNKTQSIEALRQALKLSAARLTRDPRARNLSAELQRDPRFNAVRSLPEFKDLAK